MDPDVKLNHPMNFKLETICRIIVMLRLGGVANVTSHRWEVVWSNKKIIRKRTERFLCRGNFYVPPVFFFRPFFLWRWWCAASRSDNSDGNEKTNDRIKWRQIIYFTKFMLLLLLNCYTVRCYRLPPFVTTVHHTHSGALLVFPKTQPNSTTLIFLWLIYYDLLDRMSERAEAKHFVCVIFCGIACTNRP